MGGESLSNNSGETDSTGGDASFEEAMADMPSFDEVRAEAETEEQDLEEKVTPQEYLLDMTPERREEILDVSERLTQDIPESCIVGGNALRILYEAKTGKTMFGVSKNDHDINVPTKTLSAIIEHGGVNGWAVDLELDENGNLRWVKPEQNYVVIEDAKHEHVDVFGSDVEMQTETVILDGKEIRVQSLTEQIKDKLRLFTSTDGLSSLKPFARDKYGVHAQKLLEIIEASPEDIDESELPEGWKEMLERMAEQGQFGKNEDPARANEIREKIEKERRRQEAIRRKTQELIDGLKAYYIRAQENNDPSMPTFLDAVLYGYQDQIKTILKRSSNPDEFIQNLMSGLGEQTLHNIKETIERSCDDF